jgi:hypothetical protein
MVFRAYTLVLKRASQMPVGIETKRQCESISKPEWQGVFRYTPVRFRIKCGGFVGSQWACAGNSVTMLV